MTIKDEVLSAYLDGELAPDEAERVRALLARDGDLAERLERLRLAGDLAREAFAPLAVAAAPQALRAAAGASWTRVAAPAAMAIAACAAGIVLGVSIRGDGVGRVLALDGGMIASPALSRGLGQTASGAMTRSGGVEVAPLYSFRDGSDRACRVFRAEASGAAMEGAACRDGATWRILAIAPAAVRSTDAFAQAESEEPAAVAAAVDVVYASEISAEEEARLIAREWR
jgi:anti-sigma factor RsiW